MTKRAEKAERTQGKNGAGPELAHLTALSGIRRVRLIEDLRSLI